MKHVWGGRGKRVVAVRDPDESRDRNLDWLVALSSQWMSRTTLGLCEEATIVDTPAAVAISAAISLVSIPPVPKLEPRVFVLTEW